MGRTLTASEPGTPEPAAATIEQPSTLAPAATEPTEPQPDHRWVLYCGAGVLLLAGIGTSMGAKGTLAIYHGWGDFWLSALLPVAIWYHEEPYVLWAAGALLLLSVELARRANQSLPKVILVLPAKFLLPVLTLLAGVVALGSASRLLRGETKDARDAASTAIAGAACAAAFWYLSKLIRQLVEAPRPPLLEAEPQQQLP